jgi:hypothetical protein
MSRNVRISIWVIIREISCKFNQAFVTTSIWKIFAQPRIEPDKLRIEAESAKVGSCSKSIRLEERKEKCCHWIIEASPVTPAWPKATTQRIQVPSAKSRNQNFQHHSYLKCQQPSSKFDKRKKHALDPQSNEQN